MKKILLIFAAILLMAGFTNKVMAQATDTKSNDAKASIIGAIALTVANPLEFGAITPGTGGTVIIDVEGGRTKTGTVGLVTGTAPTAASYTVTGTGLATYAITIPTDPIIITNTTGASETMEVTEMDCSYGALTSVFAAGGTDAFTVGGTLTVLTGQVAGFYTGPFEVTVAYN
jgi:hypothetical protein